MYVYGKNVVKELINSKRKIDMCFLIENFHDKELTFILKEKRIPITYLKKSEMDKKINGVHQGVIAKIADYRYYSIEDVKEDVIVILDHIEDVHNFGAIIRTCEAAGIKSIIIPKVRNVDVNATVMKTSTGAVEHVKIIKVANLVQTMKDLKNKGYWLIGTDMDGSDYTTLDYTGKIALVISNEGSGISRLVKEECDFIASIPMKGRINSLNASVAAGIMIYRIVMSREL